MYFCASPVLYKALDVEPYAILIQVADKFDPTMCLGISLSARKTEPSQLSALICQIVKALYRLLVDLSTVTFCAVVELTLTQRITKQVARAYTLSIYRSPLNLATAPCPWPFPNSPPPLSPSISCLSLHLSLALGRTNAQSSHLYPPPT